LALSPFLLPHTHNKFPLVNTMAPGARVARKRQPRARAPPAGVCKTGRQRRAPQHYRQSPSPNLPQNHPRTPELSPEPSPEPADDEPEDEELGGELTINIPPVLPIAVAAPAPRHGRAEQPSPDPRAAGKPGAKPHCPWAKLPRPTSNGLPEIKLHPPPPPPSRESTNSYRQVSGDM
jgi:hypothetical protein